MLQNIIVGVILIAVAAYLTYRAIQFFSKKNSNVCACENCGNCPKYENPHKSALSASSAFKTIKL